MRRFVIVLLLLLGLVGAGTTGCLVQSLQSCHQVQDRVAMPAVAGHWLMVTEFGEAVTNAATPWKFEPTSTHASAFRITAYETGGPTSYLYAAFFSVAGQTYCEFTAEQTKQENSFWLPHYERIHTLTRVESSADRLRFFLLDEGWFRGASTNQAAPLSFVQKAHGVLVTSDERQWRVFLEKNANAPGMFDTNKVYQFRRTAPDAKP